MVRIAGRLLAFAQNYVDYLCHKSDRQCELCGPCSVGLGRQRHYSGHFSVSTVGSWAR